MTVTLVHVSTEEPVQMMSTPIHVAVCQDTLVKTAKQVGYFHYQNICPNL